MPLVAFVRSEQRAARVRELLRLAPPGGSQRTTVAAIAVLAVLVGIGAAQPVLEETTQLASRSDAQAFLILDTSRSMLAATEPGEETRFERARDAALRFRKGLAEVPFGLASLTDRVLPLVFPTADHDTFEATLRLALDVDRPASQEAEDVRATEFGALASVGERNFFRGAKNRLAVVFTDAETTDFNSRAVAASLSEGNVELIVVRFAKPGERVFGPEGAPEPYQPDPAGAASAERLASAVGGRAFHEDDLGDAIDSARSMIGEGPTVVSRTEQSDIEPLAPYVFLVALLPLGLLLYRRNFA